MMKSKFYEDLQIRRPDTSDDDRYAEQKDQAPIPSQPSARVHGPCYRGTRYPPSTLPSSPSLVEPAINSEHAEVTLVMPGAYNHGVNIPGSSFPIGHPSHAIPTKLPNVLTLLVTAWSIISQRNRQGEVQGTLLNSVEPPTPRNIVVFGETGTGKSSLINMLADDQVAPTSNRAVGCTSQSAQYLITIGGIQYRFWDTVGLDEAEEGSIPPEEAAKHLVNLVEQSDGLSLLVYCIRGSRYQHILEINYNLFAKIICQEKIPVVVVVTGLENEERMENWWDANEREFTSRNLKFAGHACVTTTKGKKNIFEREYEASRGIVRDLIQRYCPDEAWAVQDPDIWHKQIAPEIQAYNDNRNGDMGTVDNIERRSNLHLLIASANHCILMALRLLLESLFR